MSNLNALQDIEQNKDISSYLSFMLDDQLFALNVQKVIEILEVPPITKIPRAPEYMAGVINLRGNVLPLIDTKVKFGLPPVERTINTCVIVIEITVEGETMNIGTLVDEVLEVLEVDKKEIKPSPTIEAKYNLDFIEGVFRKDEEFIMLLNLSEIFSLGEVSFMQDANQLVTEKKEQKA